MDWEVAASYFSIMRRVATQITGSFYAYFVIITIIRFELVPGDEDTFYEKGPTK